MCHVKHFAKKSQRVKTQWTHSEIIRREGERVARHAASDPHRKRPAGPGCDPEIDVGRAALEIGAGVGVKDPFGVRVRLSPRPGGWRSRAVLALTILGLRLFTVARASVAGAVRGFESFRVSVRFGGFAVGC